MFRWLITVVPRPAVAVENGRQKSGFLDGQGYLAVAVKMRQVDGQPLAVAAKFDLIDGQSMAVAVKFDLIDGQSMAVAVKFGSK